MKKIALLTIYCLLFTICSSYAQVPADSLTGTYAGQYWYANPATNPWTITQDTVYVTNIDSVNCAVQAHDAAHFSLDPPPPPDTNYYTDYYSCNGAAPSNFYVKFYSGDSMKLINDNEPQPPPNSPISLRFYGERISNKITNIRELGDSKQVKIYPNPCNGILTIENSTLTEELQIIIYDLLGREIKKENLQVVGKVQMDVGDLINGIYYFQIKTNKICLIKKLIINKI